MTKQRYSPKRAAERQAARDADERRFCQFCFVELGEGETYDFRCPECGEEFDEFWALTFEQMEQDKARQTDEERRTCVDPCRNSYLHTLNGHRHTAHPIVVTPTRVIGPCGEELRQEAPGAQTVADVLHVGDLCKSNYGEMIYRVTGVRRITECTCTEWFCANRIDDSSLQDPLGPLCHLLYCWAVSLCTPDTRIRRDGKVNENDEGFCISELVNDNGRIRKLYCSNDDEVFIVRSENFLPALQMPLF